MCVCVCVRACVCVCVLTTDDDGIQRQVLHDHRVGVVPEAHPQKVSCLQVVPLLIVNLLSLGEEWKEGGRGEGEERKGEEAEERGGRVGKGKRE